MRVSIFGLGYVGCVSVACLSDRRHHVIGVDVDKAKVDAIAHGFPTVVEPKIDQLLADGFREGRVSGHARSDPGRTRERCVDYLRWHADHSRRIAGSIGIKGRCQIDRRRAARRSKVRT